MGFTLKDKVVVVTGGAKGIGHGIADKYLEQGAKITIILDINEERGNESVIKLTSKYGDGKAEFIKCDVTMDLEPVSNILIDKYDQIDILVLNAGTESQEPKKMMGVYFTSVVEWALKFFEYMRIDNGGKGGTIIINSSIFGFRITPFAPVYQASKFGVLGLAKSLGHDTNFKKTGIRVVTICPGFTRTDFGLPIFDPELKKTFPNQGLVKFADTQPWQNIEAVGKAAVDIFKVAQSGSVWVIEGDKLTELT